MQLVQNGEVLNRLNGIQGFKLPTSITPARLDDYIDGASGIILQKVGLEDPPKEGSTLRDALNDLCVRLVVLTVLGDLYGTNPEMREANRRERNDLLKEAEALEEEVEEGEGGAGDFFFEVAGAR